MRYKKKRSAFKIILSLITACALLFCVAVVSTFAYISSTADPINPEEIYDALDRSSYIYDADNNLIDTIFYTEDREPVSYTDIPTDMKNAIIAIEDKTFYSHHGFNFKRMIGAVWSSIRGGSEISGTSTITQQLARNVFLSDIKSERSIKRKLTEMVYAEKIERTLSKEQILEAYLNTIYLGFGCYGIDSAAETYFSKDVDELTLDECALLAALPQAPDTYSPLKNEESDTTEKISSGLYVDNFCEERRDLVLDLMQEQGYISAKEAEEAKIPFSEIIKPSSFEHDSSYTYFKDYLISQVSSDLADELSISKEEAKNMVYTDGLKIYSTIDPDAQEVVLDEFEDDYNFPYSYSGNDVQAAMVITEVGTGKIVAMVGGRNASGEMLFNRATTPRQPGSSIKPLAVYSAALQKSYECAEEGRVFGIDNYNIDRQGSSGWGEYITASSTIIDERTYINGQQWPNNASRSFTGRKTFRSAIQQSINTCAVKTLYQVGFDYSVQMLKKYGITTLVTDGSTNDVNAAALALGAMTEGVSTLEMSLAYAAFPNGGIVNTPISYTKVENSDGEVILTSKSKETQVLDEGVAFIMTDVLKSVVTNGLGNPASISGVQVGGKTGTTNDAETIWFAGFSPNYSAALWIGTDTNDELATTSSTAARLWGTIMDQIPEVKEGSYKDQPNDVIKQYGEYYTKGTEPYRTTESSSSRNSDSNWSRADDDSDDSIWERAY